ncbi:CheR family methyltransferase [Maridesulfovibrio salexigens]|uniref:MCP methyltransferase, CheR-type n=1 Tax=Maridesulfovibrio salexigens (strain ATCC 14822 / DSM 2638 / NCIMB 8403 / VKM B-1763) TaxID=526222 RepID=C6BU38_MARSD|nr:protein-glutamate O-methyltransferase CheR [Maridesulfovibrio salexigens]ACS81747.1 MCP methyltransferase, CheR-type [Maridesulfovibrio salexigens DSM 2638]
MNVAPFLKILNRAMGLAPDSLSRSGIELALRARMRETATTEKSYLSLVRASDEELAELVEEIVVPETWFFRDNKPFELLFETVAGCSDEFRVLSAPCSTGEEPYSIAMTLMGAGLKNFRVDGVDISERALHKARGAVYGDNSFRSELPIYAQSWFRKCEQGRMLAPEIKDSVNFHAGNIIDGCLPNGRYDVIFCRNLLIYLDDGSRKCLAALLNEKLKDDGLLFVGHAEILPVFNDWFTPVRKQGTFALRKGKRKVATLLKQPVCPHQKCPPNSFSGSGTTLAQKAFIPAPTFKQPEPDIGKTKAVDAAEKSVEKIESVEPTAGSSIEEIKALADRGSTTKALSMCDELLRQAGPEPELFHLCGLLHEAGGNISMAEEFYGKALYLEPDHMESLVHLALLLENRGDLRKAEIMRNRARRAEKRNEAG